MVFHVQGALDERRQLMVAIHVLDLPFDDCPLQAILHDTQELVVVVTHYGLAHCVLARLAKLLVWSLRRVVACVNPLIQVRATTETSADCAKRIVPEVFGSICA